MEGKIAFSAQTKLLKGGKMMKRRIIVSFVMMGIAVVLFGQAGYAQDAMLGEIRMFAGTYAPRGWAFCDGRILSISGNQELYSLLGTTYGGNGRTNFALPDLRGRVSIGAGRAPGLSSYRPGMKGGSETVRLNVNQMPAHSHPAEVTVNASSEEGNSAVPTKNVWAKTPEGSPGYSTTSNTAMGGAVNVTVGQVGGGQPYENRSPYQVINFIISLEGYYPSRT